VAAARLPLTSRAVKVEATCRARARVNLARTLHLCKGGEAVKAVAIATLVALGPLLAGCSSLPSFGPISMSSPDSSQAIEYRTPLELKDELERLGVFAECAIGDVRVDVRGNPTEVYCGIVPFDARTSTPFAEDKRAVFVWVYKEGQYSKDLLCSDFTWGGADRFKVTDGGSFLAFGTNGLRDGEGLWPKEVWPSDVKRVLGGEVVADVDFCG
jgi:hypothetical protein